MLPLKMTPENERLIIEGCIKGNPNSQYSLYKSLSAKMFAVCLRYAPDYHTAEDLLQEGFVKVFKNLEKYRGEGSFEGWIRRIFVNTAIEHYRKNSRMYSVREVQPEDAKAYDSDALSNLQESDVLRLLQDLSPGYRTVFNLYVIEGFNHQQIADKLGISEGTSKSQLARARYILQEKVIRSERIAKQKSS